MTEFVIFSIEFFDEASQNWREYRIASNLDMAEHHYAEALKRDHVKWRLVKTTIEIIKEQGVKE
jgi:hypothetical protein